MSGNLRYLPVLDMVATVVWAAAAIAALLHERVGIAFVFIAVASVFGRMATSQANRSPETDQ